MNGFRKWDSLNSFHDVIRGVNKVAVHRTLRDQDYKVTYGFKIKIHGTNAGVRVQPNGQVAAQRRSSDIPGDTDNGGFRAWVEANPSYWATFHNPDLATYVWGEWAGPGIQQDVACSATPEPVFYPFAIDTYDVAGQLQQRLYDPQEISFRMSGTMPAPSSVKTLPYHSKVTIDFGDKDATVATVMALNDEVEQIGERDPLMASMFGIEGKGEGLVGYPMVGNGLSYAPDEIPMWSVLNFKAKAENLRVNRSRDAVHLKAQWFPTKNLFAEAFCTEQRMEQALAEAVDGQLDPCRTRDFIEWVKADILKESVAEREESNIDWNDVVGGISANAALWYKGRIALEGQS
ncbi:hypothetical protein ASE85_03325 [Sphingobium sp. Leaf26]|uniref:RNA ligase family protein n=1 Tax=Sphingobium sp. Leaf26 TaxID=1735693 RepID=UPI0006F7877E|nr:RNA ligase family protein [Sphingobium sp. Leaf26]KQN09975.1 hypothetical protein ASE85_03325 [Sphingobium sp. Leaf26]